jgi:hypothetical protein
MLPQLIDHPNMVVDTDPVDMQKEVTMDTDIVGNLKDKKRVVRTERWWRLKGARR